VRSLPTSKVVAVGLALSASSADAATGPTLWSQPGCGGCHTLSGAGSSGTVGPTLDDLKPSSATVAAQVASGGGGMPSFAGTLTSSQIQQLPAWVASAASGGSGAAGATPASPNAGMSASAVRNFQHDLHRLGSFNGPHTGFFGPITTAR
jgi:mono/diheme cytochrome c family protein